MMNEWMDSDRQKLSYLRAISPYLSLDQKESRTQLEEKHRQVFGEAFPASIRAMINAVGARDEWSIHYKVRNLLDKEEDMTMNWSDSQRAQLLQIYKDKISSLGEEEFFSRFDEIREEAYKTMGIEIERVNEESIQAGYAPGYLTYENGSLFPSEFIPHDNRPYAVNCTDGKGILQSHLAEGYIISPTGRRIGAMCKSCAQVVIDEYQTKLGQTWTFEPQDWQPVTQKQIKVGVEGRGLHQLAEMGTYVDPVHSSAATLGRLGGRAKSEAKTASSRSNGKKGGRPAVKQLDLEEI